VLLYRGRDNAPVTNASARVGKYDRESGFASKKFGRTIIQSRR
jgi:hypothetical protein